MWRILILSWYIKESLSVSVLLCYMIKSLDWDLRMRVIHDIIACYSEVFWSILFHAILKIWEWYFDISIYHFFELKIWWRQLQNYCATIMIILYGDDTLIFDTHIMMKMISRYYHSIITQISIKYQNINSQTNNILSKYFDKQQYCT